MKMDRADRAPHIILMTKRFNELSQLVVSEIVRRPTMSSRIAVIEKWAAVADIARCLHNFNGVLQVCAAFTNSSVFRLKKTWEKVSKTVERIFPFPMILLSICILTRIYKNYFVLKSKEFSDERIFLKNSLLKKEN